VTGVQTCALPISLSLRGAISSGFRAPSLAQTSYKSVSTVFENGVPSEVGLFPVDEPAAQALGARKLAPEESVNMTAGFIFNEGNFSLTLDAYRIDIDRSYRVNCKPSKGQKLKRF